MANFCTLNPLNSTLTLTNGNLGCSSPGATWRHAKGTFGLTSGKWYWECVASISDSNNGYLYGVANENFSNTVSPNENSTGVWGRQSVTKYNNGSNGSLFSTTSAGDILSWAFDADSGKLWVGVNGTWTGDPSAGTGESWSSIPSNVFPIVGSYAQSLNVNFGQFPWRYDPPTGFVALSTENLAEPAISNLAAEKPEDYFNVVTYTGDETSDNQINGVGFQPDLIWIKRRDGASDHSIQDSVRGFGATTKLSSSSTDDENNTTSLGSTGYTDPKWGYVNNISADGFSVNASTAGDHVNNLNSPYVAWCWKAGGAAVENTDGSITSQVSANQEAGFSIVSYTGTGSAATVGHGLNAAPSLIIVKPTNEIANWVVYHSSIGATKYLLLNTTAAEDTASTVWNNTAPTSSVFSLGTNTNVNGNTTQEIAYCWAEVEGYSKIGEWTNANSTDGAFIYCGFRPAFILLKNTDNVENWYIQDNLRPSYNYNAGSGQYLSSNLSNGEFAASTAAIDFVSNGFKIRTSNPASGEISFGTRNYIFIAFADSPFKYASAR